MKPKRKGRREKKPFNPAAIGQAANIAGGLAGMFGGMVGGDVGKQM
jgi:hypothetical protein